MIRIAITLGDPCGVGPEIVLRVLHGWKAQHQPRYIPIVYGRRRDLEDCYANLRHTTIAPLADPVLLETVSQLAVQPARPILLEPDVQGPPARRGQFLAELAPVVVESLQRACDDARAGQVDALVTGPINKQSLSACGCEAAGQSEFLAKRTGTRRWTMVLTGKRLTVGLVTTHMALAAVATSLTPTLIVEKATAVIEFLRDSLSLGKPRLAICALNPHAGDAGRFGDEETRIIQPAIELLRSAGCCVEGPWPADSVFAEAIAGKFDAVLAQYHDQGLGPLKLYAGRQSVNVTAGLAIIRTSPDHGVAYDIAGKGVADSRSMQKAILMAQQLARIRQRTSRTAQAAESRHNG